MREDAPVDLGESLLEGLAGRLPAYMVPAQIVILPELPLTPNQKLDRRDLARRPLPIPGQARAAGEFRAPEPGLEQELAELWQELLGIERVGADDNFFQLGGHSLLVTRMVLRIQETHDVTLELKRLFLVRTLAELASYLEDAITATRLSRVAIDDEEDREELEL